MLFIGKPKGRSEVISNVAMIPVVLDDVDASTLVLTTFADDKVPLLNTYVDGVGVALPVIFQEDEDVNTSVVVALVAEDYVLLLEAAANADVEVLVPPAVLVDAVSATAEGSGVLVFTVLAVLDVDGDELEAAANADVEVLMPYAVLVDAVSATVEGSGVLVFITLAVLDVYGDELLDSASAEVLVGTGVDVAMIPVVLDDVDASTPVLNAVANDGVLLPEAVDAEVEVLSSPAVLEHVEFASGKNSKTLEPSSPVKLGAGLAFLSPIRVSMDSGGVVAPVKSTTIEVQVSTEVKSDSAWSDIGHSTVEEYTASPLRVIIYPPPHQTRPPILIIVETNTTALDITNKAAILFCMSPTCVDASYLYGDCFYYYS